MGAGHKKLLNFLELVYSAGQRDSHVTLSIFMQSIAKMFMLPRN